MGVDEGGWYLFVKEFWVNRGVEKGGCSIDGRFLNDVGDVLLIIFGNGIWGVCGDGLLLLRAEGL